MDSFFNENMFQLSGDFCKSGPGFFASKVLPQTLPIELSLVVSK